MQSDFNKVKFELEKYKGENAILKKQNEALHAYLQDSQVQLNKEKEKVSEKGKVRLLTVQKNLIQILLRVTQMKAQEVSVGHSTTLQTNNSEKWPHKDKHTQKHKKPKKHKKTRRTPCKRKH